MSSTISQSAPRPVPVWWENEAADAREEAIKQGLPLTSAFCTVDIEEYSRWAQLTGGGEEIHTFTNWTPRLANPEEQDRVDLYSVPREIRDQIIKLDKVAMMSLVAKSKLEVVDAWLAVRKNPSLEKDLTVQKLREVDTALRRFEDVLGRAHRETHSGNDPLLTEKLKGHFDWWVDRIESLEQEYNKHNIDILTRLRA